jgi:hypothetical protein
MEDLNLRCDVPRPALLRISCPGLLSRLSAARLTCVSIVIGHVKARQASLDPAHVKN